MQEQVSAVQQESKPTQMVEKLTTMEKNKMGMLLFIASEAVFFALLIIAYVYYHGPEAGPSAAKNLDIVKTGIFSLFLFASSFTVWRAGKNMEKRNHKGLITWLIITIVLGAVFLVGQGAEYLNLLSQNVTVSSNLFGTTFFTLTGFHGLHVLIGLIMLTILSGLAIAGDFKGPHSAAVEAISLYWHFVDVVWVFVFSVIYLWAFFG